MKLTMLAVHARARNGVLRVSELNREQTDGRRRMDMAKL